MDYLEGMEFQIPKKDLYDKIRSLERKLQIKYVMLTQAKAVAKKANKEKSRTATLLLTLRGEGKLNMTDIEISERCFVTKRSIIEAKSRMKKAANYDN